MFGCFLHLQDSTCAAPFQCSFLYAIASLLNDITCIRGCCMSSILNRTFKGKLPIRVSCHRAIYRTVSCRYSNPCLRLCVFLNGLACLVLQFEAFSTLMIMFLFGCRLSFLKQY